MKEYRLLMAVMLLLLIGLTGGALQNRAAMAEASDEEVKRVALTFDDGPKAGKTEGVLDVLKEKGVPATFFLIGSQVSENAALVQRLAAEGHQIGIHTYNHVDLSHMNASEQKEEIQKSKEAIEAIVGEMDFVLRPPFGEVNSQLESWLDMPIILWDVDTLDWKGKPAAEIVRETAENIRDGDIILMHDISEYSAQATGGIIDELERMGYTFLTVDQLFATRKITLEAGESYHRAR